MVACMNFKHHASHAIPITSERVFIRRLVRQIGPYANELQSPVPMESNADPRLWIIHLVVLHRSGVKGVQAVHLVQGSMHTKSELEPLCVSETMRLAVPRFGTPGVLQQRDRENRLIMCTGFTWLSLFYPHPTLPLHRACCHGSHSCTQRSSLLGGTTPRRSLRCHQGGSHQPSLEHQYPPKSLTQCAHHGQSCPT